VGIRKTKKEENQKLKQGSYRDVLQQNREVIVQGYNKKNKN